MTVLEVPSNRLRPGDRILAVQINMAGQGFHEWTDRVYVITRVELTLTRVLYECDQQSNFWKGGFSIDRSGKAMHTVRVVRGDVKPAVAASDFPHSCTNCGKPAYVGFTALVHKDTGNERCPS